MVFLRKVKWIEKQPCLITNIDVDSERRRLCVVDISNSIYIILASSLHNCMEQWRATFEKEKDYSSIGSINHIIYRFSSFEINKPLAGKFSNGQCSLKNTMPLQKSNNQQSGTKKTITTVSQTSNKKININVLYSMESSIATNSEKKRNKISNFFDSEKSDFEDNSNKELYALAVLEISGNIKVFSPFDSMANWVMIGNIVYKNNEFQTLDFAWSFQSQYLFVSYSDGTLVQYDANEGFSKLRRFDIEVSTACRIIPNKVNECIILKNQTKSCKIMNCNERQTFEMKVFDDQNDERKNAQKKTFSIKESQLKRKSTQQILKEDFLEQQKIFDVKLTRNTDSGRGKSRDNLKNVHQEQQNIQGNHSNENLDDSQDDSQIVDKDFNEKLNDCFHAFSSSSSSVSKNGQFICLSSINSMNSNGNNTALLFADITNSNQTNIFDWMNGLDNEQLPVNAECSCFSDYSYIEWTNKQTINSLEDLSNMLSQTEEEIEQLGKDGGYQKQQQYSILAIGSDRNLVIFMIHTDIKGLFIRKVMMISDLKSSVSSIIWLDAYTLLILLSDYSLFYIKLSPFDIGLAIQQIP